MCSVHARRSRKECLMRIKGPFVLLLMTFATVAATSARQQTAPTAAPTAPAEEPAVPSCPDLATAMTALMRNDVRLRDWAELARYREANRSVAAPAARESRVVFMGDSITDSWPQPRFGEFFPRKPYIGRGISGPTRPQMHIRV